MHAASGSITYSQEFKHLYNQEARGLAQYEYSAESFITFLTNKSLILLILVTVNKYNSTLAIFGLELVAPFFCLLSAGDHVNHPWSVLPNYCMD